MSKKLNNEKNGQDKVLLTKQQTIDIIKEEQELNEKLKKIGNELVFKHLIVKDLVYQCLKTHKKEHDERLENLLYERFMKELN